jgi:vitamin B12 transporter
MSVLSRCGRTVRRLAGTLPALAAAASHAQARLDNVVVTATRTPTRVADAVADVTVLDRTALDRADGRTLVELLAQQPGLQFSSNGGLGKASSLFIRGLEARHTLLLVDGVRVGSATVPSPSFDNLPLESIERIEIVRGPMSALYGSDAVGGVIQVFTRRGREGMHGNAKLSAGSHRYAQAAGGLAFGEGGFDAAVQVQHTENRGISATNANVPFGSFDPDPDGFNQNAGTLHLGWQIAPHWHVQGLVLESNGITQIDDGPGVDARARLRNAVQALRLAGRLSEAWQTRLSVARSVDVYDTLSSASVFASLGAIASTQRQLGWENEIATPLGTALVLAERTEQEVDKPDPPFDVRSRRIDAVGIGLSGAAVGHHWQASLRGDHNSQFGHQTTGALGYAWQFAPAWRAGASLGTSFVAPSFNQLYYPGFGNPDLQPEEGRHAELNLRWVDGAHSVRAAWYGHRIRGYIPSGPQPVNVPRTRIEGVTVAYEGRVANLGVGASVDHVDSRNVTAGSANFDRQLPRRAKNALRAQADWASGAWSAGATLAAFSARFDDAANALRLGGYATLDLRADRSFANDWTLGLRLNNVGGKVYETAYGYNQPGRELFVTLRYAPR